MAIEKDIDPKFAARYSISDWERWDGNWELLKGMPWSMSPAPSRKHQRILSQLFLAWNESLKNCQNCRAELPINYRISEDTILQPDLLVVCNDNSLGLYLDVRPEVVVEILSPSTASKDLNQKAWIYAEAGIPYYLLIHPEEEWVRVMLLKDGEWVNLFEGKTFPVQFDLPCGKVELKLETIWH